jgi:uncharacterized membrane protein ArfC
MHNVNWWLMALAFLLGLVLTLFLTIRRAKAEVAEHATPADVEEPYGAGSVRVAAGAAPPSGYEIKGNEDAMLYHSPDSPSYQVTVAEVWFLDVQTAEKAGFNRWDSGGSQSEET